MNRIIRNRGLILDEGANYNAREKRLPKNCPELTERHEERMASLETLRKLFVQIKPTRESKE
jgi:hypothetical protein